MEIKSNFGMKSFDKKELDEILIVGRLADQKVNEAIFIQDELSKKSGKWSGQNEIRKWREKS